MVETLQLYSGVRMSAGDDVGLPVNSADLQQVRVWDVGPEEPMPPREPVTPEGKNGDPKYEMAKLRYQKALKKYAKDLDEYERLQTEFEKWQRQNGGPVELCWWSIDASQNMQKDLAAVREGRQAKPRYYVSTRTRGWKNRAPNLGLPEGMKPGHGQADLERRALEHDSEFAAAMRSDPVFGQPELR